MYQSTCQQLALETVYQSTCQQLALETVYQSTCQQLALETVYQSTCQQLALETVINLDKCLILCYFFFLFFLNSLSPVLLDQANSYPATA